MDKNERYFIMFIFFMGIARNDGIPLPDYLMLILIVCGVACWVFVMLNTFFTKRERLGQCGLLAVATVSVIMNHHFGSLLACMVILGMKDAGLKKTLWTLLCIQIVVVIINAGIFIADILFEEGIKGYYQQRNIMGMFNVAGKYRVYFGTLHPNSTQRLICLISVLLLYLRFESLKLGHIIFLTLLNALFYFLTFSNTGLLLWFLSAFVIYCLKMHDNWIRWIGKAGPIIFAALLILVLYCSFFYTDDSIAALLNRWITGRFLCAYQYIETTGLSAWGKELSVVMRGVDLDCAYINLLLCYGYIVSIFYWVGVFILMVALSRKNQYLDVIMLLMIHGFFVIESFIMVVYMNWTFLYLGLLFYRRLGSTKEQYPPVISA